MHDCDRALRAASRKAFGGTAWMNAGVAFIREGLQRGCLNQLNELADRLDPEAKGRTRLSERSIDELFESGETTDAFVARLRLEAEADPQFGELLRREFGDRLFTRELQQPELFG